MLQICQRFKVDLPLYRVDLYWYKNEWYGGEITLSSGDFNSFITNDCSKIPFHE